MTILRTADDWLAQPQYEGITVMDPDGWDRKNIYESWAEEITEAEFAVRLCFSTCQYSTERMEKFRE